MANPFQNYLEALKATLHQPGLTRSKFDRVMYPGPDSSLLVVTVCAVSLALVSVETIVDDLRTRSYWRMAFWLLVMVPVTVQYLFRAFNVLPGLWRRRG